MLITRYNPLIADLDKTVEEMFDDFALWRPVARARAVRAMPVEAWETDGHFRVGVEIPGVHKEDINVAIEGSQVTISCEVKEEKEAGPEAKLLFSERRAGQCSRTLQLGCELDRERAEAKYVDGILTLILPKASNAMPKRLTVH
ncbi:MAG TPA: Hsp20/alpha crystallin family protein [Burkholderiales bacterium]|nr:Hsp20/alpha crystallin family protein [Burkholderiales bacterium]